MKTRTIVLLLTVLPALASAESYLCVEDEATGFSFNTAQKRWQQAKFTTGKYLVKPNKDQPIKARWIVSEIGEPSFFAWSERDFGSGGGLRFEAFLGEFAMNRKTLRFVRTHIAGYWLPDALPGEDPGARVEGKNTPYISIGKCSLLEP